MSNWISYLRERWDVRLWVLTLLLAAASFAGASWNGPFDALGRAFFSGLLVLQFRLADDLASIDNDRVRHPHRVLVTCTSRRPFVIGQMCIAFFNLLLSLLIGLFALALLGGINVLLAAWYAGPRPPRIEPFVVLLKYPGIVAVLAAEPNARWDWQFAVVCATIYVVLLVYEAWHDIDWRRALRGQTESDTMKQDRSPID